MLALLMVNNSVMKKKAGVALLKMQDGKKRNG